MAPIDSLFCSQPVHYANLCLDSVNKASLTAVKSTDEL